MLIPIIDMSGEMLDRVLAFLIIDLLAEFTKSEKKSINSKSGKLFCILCSCFFYKVRFWAGKDLTVVIITVVAEVGIYSIYVLAQKRISIWKALSCIFATETLITMCGFVSAGLVYFTVNVDESSTLYPLAKGALYLYLLIPFGIMYMIEKRYHVSALMKHKIMQYAVNILGIMIMVTTLPIRVNSLKSNTALMYLLIIVLCILFSWAVLWTVSRYFSEREKEKILADNKKLSAKLHRTKEFFPALVQTIQKLQSEGEVESLQPLIAEIQELCEVEILERKNEDMDAKQFMSTGILMLDELISGYGKEAAQKNITFDMYAGTPVDIALKERNMSPIDFVRIVGDLSRNAFRAIDRGKQAQGAILLTMGYVDGIFELDIYDNGRPFSVEVLERLGETGNTEGGTGYGLADVLNCLEEYQCSFKIEEYAPEDEFTKGISIFWDKNNARLIESDRELALSDTCILTKV